MYSSYDYGSAELIAQKVMKDGDNPQVVDAAEAIVKYILQRNDTGEIHQTLDNDAFAMVSEHFSKYVELGRNNQISIHDATYTHLKNNLGTIQAAIQQSDITHERNTQ